jgi:hypothetical protein
VVSGAGIGLHVERQVQLAEKEPPHVGLRDPCVPHPYGCFELRIRVATDDDVDSLRRDREFPVAFVAEVGQGDDQIGPFVERGNVRGDDFLGRQDGQAFLVDRLARGDADDADAHAVDVEQRGRSVRHQLSVLEHVSGEQREVGDLSELADMGRTVIELVISEHRDIVGRRVHDVEDRRPVEDGADWGALRHVAAV